MRHLVLVAAVLAAACGHGNDPAKTGPGSSAPTLPPTLPPSAARAPIPTPPPALPPPPAPAAPATPPSASATPTPAPTADAAPEGHDFTPEALALFAVGACGDVAPPAGFDPKVLAEHCEVIKKAQSDYTDKWLKVATPFFEEHVPKTVPKKVVYPFAGGDLSTALTVYPDADEITTISLEPAGDPRTLATLQGDDLEHALDKIEYELKFLYRVNFSNTMNMIDAMRAGLLPTQLDLRPVRAQAPRLRGRVAALLQAREGRCDPLPDRRRGRGRARCRQGEGGEAQHGVRECRAAVSQAGRPHQIWRHIRANLGNDDSPGIGPGLKSDPRVVKHLEQKGEIAGMTKAASYLLSWESFSIMRNYLIGHVQWMVSDATGVAPKWGKPAGFEYETYGGFQLPHIEAGHGIAKDWRDEFASEPKRELKFRFGYYDKHATNHLVIMRKKG